jgi:hypothetical protein
VETLRDENAQLSVSIDPALNSSNYHKSLRVSADQTSYLAQFSSAGNHLLFVNLMTNLLRNDHRVRFVTKGGSMYPTIRDGEAITVKPTSPAQIRHRDIVHYERAGYHSPQVLDKVIFFERQGRKIGLDNLRNRLMQSMVSSLIRCGNHVSKTGILRFLKRTE